MLIEGLSVVVTGGASGLGLATARRLGEMGAEVTVMVGRLRDNVRDSLASSIPHPKRLGDPDDYARLAVSIVENPYLNGETIRLDGSIRMGPR